MTTQRELYEIEDTDIDAVSGGVLIDWQTLSTDGDHKPNPLDDIICK